MCNPARDRDEEDLAALLSALRDPPRPWIEAAKELPAARLEIAAIVERARSDDEYRASVIADLEDALRLGGHAPTAPRIAALRAGVERPQAP